MAKIVLCARVKPNICLYCVWEGLVGPSPKPQAGVERARRQPLKLSARVFMESTAVRMFMHDLSNALNAAKINAYLLRRMHGEVLDKETIDGLDSALYDAEKLVSEFQQRAHNDMAAPASTH